MTNRFVCLFSFACVFVCLLACLFFTAVHFSHATHFSIEKFRLTRMTRERNRKSQIGLFVCMYVCSLVCLLACLSFIAAHSSHATHFSQENKKHQNSYCKKQAVKKISTSINQQTLNRAPHTENKNHQNMRVAKRHIITAIYGHQLNGWQKKAGVEVSSFQQYLPPSNPAH